MICANGDIVCGVGSTALRSYLPESDIDLVAFTDRDPKQFLSSVFASLFAAVPDDSHSPFRQMVIRNIEFVNARTNVVHCVVDNTVVDVTVNQLGAMATLTFLEKADKIVGHDHLFKKSLLLIKVSNVRPFNLYNILDTFFPHLAELVSAREQQILWSADNRIETWNVVVIRS